LAEHHPFPAFFRVRPNAFFARYRSDAMAKWLPPFGSPGGPHIDLKVGGTHKMSFHHRPAEDHSFGGKYLARSSERAHSLHGQFDDANLPGEMQVTVT